jgi:hypothetical protein
MAAAVGRRSRSWASRSVSRQTLAGCSPAPGPERAAPGAQTQSGRPGGSARLSG